MAFTSRFNKTCSSRTGSPYIAIPVGTEESTATYQANAFLFSRRADIMHGALHAGEKV